MEAVIHQFKLVSEGIHLFLIFEFFQILYVRLILQGQNFNLSI